MPLRDTRACEMHYREPFCVDLSMLLNIVAPEAPPEKITVEGAKAFIT
jgi:hypothetical protein